MNLIIHFASLLFACRGSRGFLCASVTAYSGIRHTVCLEFWWAMPAHQPAASTTVCSFEPRLCFKRWYRMVPLVLIFLAIRSPETKTSWSSLSSSLNFSCLASGQLFHTSSEMSCFFFLREGVVLSSAQTSVESMLWKHTTKKNCAKLSCPCLMHLTCQRHLVNNCGSAQ